MAAVPRDLTFAPAAELLRLYRARKASPLDVMQAVLGRIDAVNPQVNAIVTLARDAALWEARRATAALKRDAAAAAAVRRAGGHQGRHADARASARRMARSSSRTTCPTRTRWSSQRLRAAGAIVHRQDEHAGVRLRSEHGQHRLRRHAQPVEPRRAPPAAPAAARRPRWPPACARSPRAPISAARYAGRRPSAASSASARRPASIPRHPSVLAWD